MAATITVQRGDNATLKLDFKNADGSVYNATGSTLTLTVRRHALADSLLTKVITGFTAGGSHAEIPLSQTDLTLPVRVYRYELVLEEGSDRKTSGLNPFYVTRMTASLNRSLSSSGITVITSP